MQNPISPQFIKQIAPELSLYQYNQIPVIALQHQVGSALIALQGAQLFSWIPTGMEQDVIWLSEIEPFQQGNAIRGGIPICYPWFGPVKVPSHGTARIRLWHLTDYQIESTQVRLAFSLFGDDHLIEAKVDMIFDQQCQLIFTHYGQENAQVALHSYFHIGDIHQIEVQGLPTICTSHITRQIEKVPSPRSITNNVDCTYHIPNAQTTIVDNALQRAIDISHHSSEIVLWNPWHKTTSGMSETAYQRMICVETARISQLLQHGDQVSVTLKVRSVF